MALKMEKKIDDMSKEELIGELKEEFKKHPKTVALAMEMVLEEATAPVQKVAIETKPMTEAEVLAQEYIVLYRQYVEHDVKNLTKRMEELRKALQSIANETVEASLPAIFKCDDGEIEFSPRGKEEEVSDPKKLLQDLTEKFGIDVAMNVVRIAITPLREILSSLELKKYMKEKQGSRTLKMVKPVM